MFKVLTCRSSQNSHGILAQLLRTGGHVPQVWDEDFLPTVLSPTPTGLFLQRSSELGGLGLGSAFLLLMVMLLLASVVTNHITMHCAGLAVMGKVSVLSVGFLSL